MSSNRFSSLKSDNNNTSKNRFKSNQRYQKYKNTKDNSNNYVPPNLKRNTRWKQNDESNSASNTFKKKYNVSNRRNQNRNYKKQQQTLINNPRLQKIGELNFDIALKKASQNKKK